MGSGFEDIIIDDDIDGFDESAYYYDASAMSLASSSDQYRLENNRKYHTYRDGSYWMPHDKEAVELDTIAHHIFLLMLNDQLFRAPIQAPQKVLDVGTGNGIWALNFADKFPDADIIATDLARVQDTTASPNLRFEIDDCCSAWVYPFDHFDYIHVRLLYGSVADWDAFYKECYDHLAPGGYIEQTEIDPGLDTDDNSLAPDSAMAQSRQLAAECGIRAGRRLDIQPYIREWIAKAGFVDVVEEKYKWPIGDWPAEPRLKDIGKWNATQWNLGIESWSIRLLTQQHGWTVDQVKTYNENIRAQIAARKTHAYQAVSLVYARKPLKQ